MYLDMPVYSIKVKNMGPRMKNTDARFTCLPMH
jgi:hypothetical protein